MNILQTPQELGPVRNRELLCASNYSMVTLIRSMIFLRLGLMGPRSQNLFGNDTLKVPTTGNH